VTFSSHPNLQKPHRRFGVKLLELNTEPAIELTGDRLGWILEELFDGIAYSCVKPFFRQGEQGGEGKNEVQNWQVGEERFGLRKCLEVEVRAQGGWNPSAVQSNQG
jgi:hypothetical protein